MTTTLLVPRPRGREERWSENKNEHCLSRCQFRPIQDATQAPPQQTYSMDNQRYTFARMLGKGAHAWVVHARDELTSHSVAIKVPMAPDDAECSGGGEESILRRIQDGGVEHVVRFLRSFVWRERTCLVFEKLQATAFHALEKSTGRGQRLPPTLIRVWLAHQCFQLCCT